MQHTHTHAQACMRTHTHAHIYMHTFTHTFSPTHTALKSNLASTTINTSIFFNVTLHSLIKIACEEILSHNKISSSLGTHDIVSLHALMKEGIVLVLYMCKRVLQVLIRWHSGTLCLQPSPSRPCSPWHWV